MKYVLYMDRDLLDDNVSEVIGEASSRALQCLQSIKSQHW